MERDEAFLLDIKEAALLAMQYIADISEPDFQYNIQLQDSVIRRLEIIGEAAKRVSPDTKAKYPALPWAAMIGMRNLMSTTVSIYKLRGIR